MLCSAPPPPRPPLFALTCCKKRCVAFSPTPPSSACLCLLIAEEDVLYIASNMGMVRKELGDQQLKAAVVPKVKVASTMTVNQVSPLGIQLSVLTR